MIRAFIAVEVELTEALKNIHEKICACNCDIKPVDMHQMHITLRFLGDIDEKQVDDIAAVIARCGSTAPFELKLHGMGAFPNLNHINVVWVGVANPEKLDQMATCINATLLEKGFPKEDKPFSPHLTLARVKSGKNIQALQRLILENKNAPFGAVNVNAVYLKKSELRREGPIYTNLFEHVLRTQ
jgi:2'-5' RNA ligase